MKIFDKNIATTRTTARGATGFALIELLTAVAIIAILIGLLLPAIQRKREEAAAEQARAKVQQAANAANYYRNRTGDYPRSLAQLVQFVTSNPSPGISIDPQLASGRANGHVYEIVEADHDHCTIEAEPEFPGITGSQTVQALVTRSGGEVFTENIVTPGSDEAREEMFNRIRYKAAETVVKLLALDSSATSEVRGYFVWYSEDDLGFRANVMDTNGDGRITIDEIRNYEDPNMDSALKGPLGEFIDYVAREMKWDSLSEQESRNTAAVTTELEEFANAALVPPLFSYEGLSVLTTAGFADLSDGTSNTIGLLDKLETAEAAEAAGDQQGKARAIQDYQREVNAQIGQTLTRSIANTLITMSKTL